MTTISTARPAVAAVPVIPVPATALGGGPPAWAHSAVGGGEHGGHGGFSILGVNVGKMAVFAGIGALAAMHIPPLAFLGGPVGGAIAGALLSLVL